MKKKFRNVALAAVLGAGIVGATAFTSQASASSLETTVVEFEEASVVNEGSDVQPRKAGLVQGLTFWGKEAVKMFLGNGGAAYSTKVGVSEDAEIIFDK